MKEEVRTSQTVWTSLIVSSGRNVERNVVVNKINSALFYSNVQDYSESHTSTRPAADMEQLIAGTEPG